MDSGDLSAAGVMAVMGPTSPAEDEWETLYYYMQSAPGVFQGDLYYYLVDGDLRGRLAGLDTVQCPLYLLTGDYDLTATPQMTRELADTVNATYFAVMGGLGHFPMSEDPARFREYLYPVLDKIIDRREG
jgi:pimeloyl-ACP methyl ester carboxylesterase